MEFNSFTEDDRIHASLIPLHFPDQNQSAYRTNLGFRIALEQVMKPGRRPDRRAGTARGLAA